MSEFNFESAVCTSREQCERLLSLGLKKETADCGHFYGRQEYEEYEDWETVILNGNWQPYWDVTDEDIPAWSLHRLLSLIPKEIEVKNPYRKWICFNMNFDYNIIYFQSNMEDFIGFYEGNVYDKAISCIEWLIKEGYFNKEYLEE